MKISGDILQGANVVLRRVTGTLWLGAKGWSGIFTIPAGQFIALEGTYRLVLDDGRCGDFVIDSIPSGSHQLSFVYFSGAGPLQ